MSSIFAKAATQMMLTATPLFQMLPAQAMLTATPITLAQATTT